MVDINKAFNPETKSVYAHYQSPGVGFYIPLYQREYSWDSDNIMQLLDDIAKGVENLAENPKDEIRFLGTIIAVKVLDSRNIYPRDPQGLPSTIEQIIDGQQRLSTIALFSTLLYKHITLLEKKLKPNNDSHSPYIPKLVEACNSWKKKLKNVFSLDLDRGTPPRKPKIIRGNKDQWTKDGDVEENYPSEVANYLAKFIDYAESNKLIPTPNKAIKTGANLNKIDRWLKSIVLQAHDQNNNNGDFLVAWEIIKNANVQQDIWQYERTELASLVNQKERKDKRSIAYITCSFVQLFSVCHYLLDRCCFTIIQPMNVDWAFDMFQSLNATGTPLTAIETFKPTVVNTTDLQFGVKFKDSDAEKSFDKIDELFVNVKSASRKNKLATDLLTSFALSSAGYKLESHFSKQRKWLDETYRNTGKEQGCKDYQEQCDFINFFGNYAQFYKEIWTDYKGENRMLAPRLAGIKDAELASLLLLYLKDSNHKMAITILGRFYSDLINDKPNSASTFIEACKLIAAFYTLWRSSDSNTGLDNVYRNFFKEDDNAYSGNSWIRTRSISLTILKKYLQKVLFDKGIGDKERWLRKAKNYLSYNKSKSVSTFALFVSAHETIPDTEQVGLMKIGKHGTHQYLTLKQWNSNDLKTIEHIAPQTNKDNLWDENLYGDDEIYHQIGNLTLLPLSVNSSVGNKGWEEKYIYFQHLSEGDIQRQNILAQKAKENGYTLKQETIEILQKASYSAHIKPIVMMGEYGNWDADKVKLRTERILDVLWDRINNWIF